MNDKDQQLLEEAYRLVSEEANPDAKEVRSLGKEIRQRD
jgi:hypothetical protein